MTSYATLRDSAVAAAAAATTTTTTTTTNSNATAESAVATPGNANAIAISNAQSPPPATTAAGASVAFPSKLLQDNEDFDCDSLSDGREKADTTPENIKKIDDLIEQQRSTSSAAAVSAAISATSDASHQFALMLSSSSPSTPPSTSTTSNPSYATAGGGIGLAAAVDESNAKFRLARPAAAARPQSPRHHCEKDKSERSSESKMTPLTKPADIISNYNHSNSADPDDFNNAFIFGSNSNSNNNNDDDDSSASNTTTTATTTTNKSYAFTIDNFNERDGDPAAAAAAAAKYKNMLERFQNRHRRGASMSKLESDAQTTPTLTASASASPLTLRNARNAQRSGEDGTPEKAAADAAAPKVKLRAPRERSTSRVRDAAKRHSWSPRTSTAQEPPAAAYATPNERQKSAVQTSKVPSSSSSSRKTAPPPPPPKKPQAPLRATNLLANRTTSTTATQFTPRSTAMQLALQKIDFLCPQPPLGDFKHLHAVAANSDADNISEAGTYTLDGDNYTEEQKDLMNIDCKKSGRKQQQQQRPKDLNLQANVSEAVYNVAPHGGQSKIPVNNRAIASNVLEVNYYHESAPPAAAESPTQSPLTASPTATRLRSTATVSDFILGQHQSAGAYLEKIKSRVLRNMNATKNASPSPLPATALEITNSAAGDFSGELMKAADEEEQEDMGCFTSVTTSGVLAKQSALDPRPRLTRRSSLSTSQIDSSEYISNEAKLKTTTASAYAAGGFTDHQKAEYRLNVFTNQKDSNMQKFAATRSFIESPPDTPTSSSAAGSSKQHQQHHQQHNNRNIANVQRSDTAVLKTAQTKNDWIQEWARNARARSLAADTSSSTSKQYHRHGGASSAATSKHHDHHHNHALPPHHHHHNNQHHPQDLMTRSYTCSDTGTGIDSLTDDSIYCARQQSAVAALRLNRTLAERFRLAGDAAACCDYSSDPALCTSYAKRAAAAEENAACKPPKSPSKIPSPLHSLGRARSASRTRASLQNMLPLDGDENDESAADESADIYLQKTAAVIQSLQQSLSRKNSLKSPSTGSPRAHSARGAPPPPLLYSPPGDYSPQHSLDSPTSVGGVGGVYQLSQHHRHQQQQQRSPLHRRNHSNDGGYGAARAAREQLALMTSSINEQQLQLLTSGEYLARQMRQRKNSFDGSGGGALSPAARRPAAAVSQTQTQTLSPLRRSSSFSTKIAGTQRAARPQYQNIYTPPAARHNYVAPQRQATAASHLPAVAIKKSASSNTFRQDLYGDYDEHLAYYINDADDNDDQEPYYSSGGELETPPAEGDAPTVALSNMRYNKALLMRIERSKQKVAGATAAGNKVAAPSAPSSRAMSAAAAAGLVACPNTPELPRRNIKSAPRTGVAQNARQSIPRDTSLSRLATQVPSSLASAKKQLLQTAAAAPTIKSAPSGGGARVQPKYLDISKYKPVQGKSFLRKNDANSTLKTPVATAGGGSGADSAMKRSPSATSMGLSRGDPTRASNRSVRSAASCMTTSTNSLVGGGGGRTASSARRDASVAKQKEAEMAMWKRRSSYDPMKAAADDRRRKEEAKRLVQAKNAGEMSFESQQNSYEQQQWSPLDENEYGCEDDDE